MEKNLDFLKNRFISASDKELIRSLKFEFVYKSITKYIALGEARNREINIDGVDILRAYNELCNEQRELFWLFEDVSIRGRVAFGVTCIEKLATQHNLNSSEVNELLKLLWSYVSSANLGEWEEQIMELVPDEDDYWLFSEKFHFAHLPNDIQFLISVAIMDVVDIGRGNLYAGYRSSDTMMYLLRLIDNLKNNSVDLPDPAPFLKSKADEFHGWGYAIDPSLFKSSP